MKRDIRTSAHAIKSSEIFILIILSADHPEATLDGSSSFKLDLLNSSMPELLKQLPDMREITEYWIVYPNKIQVPLHKDDLLYESNRNTSSALILGKRHAVINRCAIC